MKTDGGSLAHWLPTQLRELRARAEAAGPDRLGALDAVLPASTADLDLANGTLRAIYRFELKSARGVLRPTVGTFPIAEVSNGHTYFVQRLHEIVRVQPVAVHTTYQYGDAANYP